MALFNYECDETKRIIDEVSPNYPQLTTYEKEWLYFHKYGYIPGIPVELEYETVNINPTGMVQNAIPHQYKRAILKGQTLVNILEMKKENYTFNNQQNWIVEDSYFKCNGTTSWHSITDKFNDKLKPSTKYLLKFEIVENTLGINISFDNYGTNLQPSSTLLTFNANEVGIKSCIVTTVSKLNSANNGLFRCPINLTNGGTLKIRFMAIEYQDGMENWDIPYFEGMKSVQMPVLTSKGKNFFNIELEQGSVNTNTGTLIETKDAIRSKDFIKLSYNEKFTISKTNGTQIITIAIYDKNYKFVRALWERTFTLTGDELYVKFADAENDLNNQYQIEKGETPSSYEPYKSNILTCNEEVSLRGIGEVKDELNLLTGEVTERIGEIVLDGSEDWVLQTNQSDVRNAIYRLPIADIDATINNRNINCICDKAMVESWNGIYGTRMDKTFAILNNHQLRVQFNGNVEDLKSWLSEVQPTVQYFKTESVKTVDLTKINPPYEGVNNYYLTANIPCEAVLEVPVVSTGEQTLKEIND